MEPTEYANIARLEERHWWYTGMAALAAGWLRQLPPQAGAPRMILDAGCGTGGGLGWLGAFGRACGVDVNWLAAQLAAQKGPGSVAQAGVEALPFAAASFDLVTSFDVLYHLRVADDEQALAEFARVLRPGGWLLLRVPAHEGLRRAHDRLVHTRHRYTRGEVREKLARAGLQPRRVTYANALLLPLALLKRLAERGEAEAASDVQPTPAPLNALLRAVLLAEGLWLRRFDLPVGMSVMGLGVKNA